MDMVRSMIDNYYLPIFLWMYALKIVMYLLNKVLSKVVLYTPFELWIGKAPNIRHLHAWGCKEEIIIYNPEEKKFDARTINEYFIGYLKKSKEVYVLLCWSQYDNCWN